MSVVTRRAPVTPLVLPAVVAWAQFSSRTVAPALCDASSSLWMTCDVPAEGFHNHLKRSLPAKFCVSTTNEMAV